MSTTTCSTSSSEPARRYAGMDAARAIDGVSTDSAAPPPVSCRNRRRSTSGMALLGHGRRRGPGIRALVSTIVGSYALLVSPSANRVYAGVAPDLTLAELGVLGETVLRGRLSAARRLELAGVD